MITSCSYPLDFCHVRSYDTRIILVVCHIIIVYTKYVFAVTPCRILENIIKLQFTGRPSVINNTRTINRHNCVFLMRRLSFIVLYCYIVIGTYTYMTCAKLMFAVNTRLVYILLLSNLILFQNLSATFYNNNNK